MWYIIDDDIFAIPDSYNYVTNTLVQKIKFFKKLKIIVITCAVANAISNSFSDGFFPIIYIIVIYYY